MKGWQTRPYLTKDSGRDQGGIGDLVGALPLLKGQAPLPPPHILVLVDETTLQITDTMLAKTKGKKIHGQRGGYEFHTHSLFMQFHGDIPVKGSALAVVARPQVLPDPMVPGFGHQRRCRRLGLEPGLEDLSQLISLPKL